MRAVERRLRERITELEKRTSDLEQERKKFRQHFQKRFRWWIELVGKQTGPKLSWLIEDDAQFLHTVERWWW